MRSWRRREVGHRKGFYEFCLKRPLDVIGAGVGLLVLAPVLVGIGLLVRVKLGSPVIFAQRRPGLHGRVFTLYKFRTMTEARDKDGALLPDEERMTPFGRWLRSTSLDELPELYNVLKGDMSLVGPRPLLLKYLVLYNRHQMRRHEVRPGVTGYAQVNGRNQLGWEDKFDMDVYYVDHVTFREDVRILLKTIRTVCKREGIRGAGAATVKPFQGNRG
ncbi:MAG: sugar transferase [Lachnospiraceae bacterium]